MEKERGSARFDLLDPIGKDPIAGEVSGNNVNVATRQLDISDILREDARRNKNWHNGCSSIIDAGFGGW